MPVSHLFASPDTAHPIRLPDGSAHPGTVYLRAVIDHPRIEVGDYTYASAHHPPAVGPRIWPPIHFRSAPSGW